MSQTTPGKAYNLAILPQSIQEDDRGHGWCFGLPPGITPDQWPLDRCNGFPLKHAFTLLLPEDYRCHGPEIVALSFFGIANDHHDGGAEETEEVVAAFRSATPPADPLLHRLWQADRSAHPRTFRVTDILDCEYAIILLTQAEFDGPFCLPPDHGYPAELYGVPRPRWLDVGAGFDYWERDYSPALDRKPEEYRIYRMFGQIPDRTLAFNRAIHWSPSANDPNAGKAPMEVYSNDIAPSGYQSPYYSSDGEYKRHDWAEKLWWTHIGGTMWPIQGIPDDFSPYYVEFDESLGGFNFGGGNAQFDFQGMKFSWNCG